MDSENPPRTACSWCLMDVNSREILDRGDKLYAWRIYELLISDVRVDPKQ